MGSDILRIVKLKVKQKFEVGKEALELAETGSTDAEGLATAISETAPRFTFFRHSYESEGQKHSPIIFIYTCPPASKIKERMVYASARNSVVFMAGREGGLEIAKKASIARPGQSVFRADSAYSTAGSLEPFRNHRCYHSRGV